jgi:hypothetical protein
LCLQLKIQARQEDRGGERNNKIHNIGKKDEEININIKNVRMKKGERQNKNGGNLYGC